QPGGILVYPLDRLSARPFGEAEHGPVVGVEPIGVIADAMRVLRGNVEHVRVGQFLGRHPGRVMTVDVQRHESHGTRPFEADGAASTQAGAYRFGGSERAYATPRATHASSCRFLRTPSTSTRNHPSIGRPRISKGRTCARLANRSVSRGSTRTRRPPCPLALTPLLLLTLEACSPNIRFVGYQTWLG